LSTENEEVAVSLLVIRFEIRLVPSLKAFLKHWLYNSERNFASAHNSLACFADLRLLMTGNSSTSAEANCGCCGTAVAVDSAEASVNGDINVRVSAVQSDARTQASIIRPSRLVWPAEE
jgi:hypothetical protein